MLCCQVSGRGFGTRALLRTGEGELGQDTWIMSDGRVVERTARRRHEVTPAEALRVSSGARTLVIGTGCLGRVAVAAGVRTALSARGIALIEAATPDAVRRYNEIRGACAAIFHVAC